jgi:putative SOS response-associated peptidase YedK
MCFTIEIHKTRTELESRFNRKFQNTSEDFEPKYYISAFEFPKLPVITLENPSDIKLMNWGLVPFWLKDSAKLNEIRLGTLNAKAETLKEKPSFRLPFRNKRCLIMSHGFFEWQHVGKEKIPYYIKLKNDELFAFAGLYDEWLDKITGEIFMGFSIITCEANVLMSKIHNSKKRMPVIIEKEKEELWVESKIDEDTITSLLRPISEDKLVAWPIGDLITNRTQNRNVPELLCKRENTDLYNL